MSHAIDGFTFGRAVYESRRSIVYRARRDADDVPVIIKCLQGAFPARQDVARLKREYQLLKRLELLDGALRAEHLASDGHGLALVVEDFGGESLDALARNEPLDAIEIVEIAARVAAQLAAIHRQGIIHRDISPANLVWNRRTGIVKVIDFGLATELGHQSANIESPSALEGTLPFMSPEQTGRTSRVVDHRSDLYSLGASLYTLLAGRPPFVSQDPMHVVHGHLALAPAPAHSVNPAVPEIASAIVQRLLEKMPERRYQSADGLVADLERCASELRAGGAGELFVLGLRDAPMRLQIPQLLYGRERETQRLLEAYTSVRDGARVLLLIGGYSGIGKTALVQEVHRPISADHGLFVRGKFDQFRRDIAYSAVAEALRDLARQLLTQPEEQLAAWREQLRQAVGVNGRVVLELVPEAAPLLGEQPPLAPLPPPEAKARFQSTLQRFVQAIATAEHPLVLFLDDLQWADTAALDLLETLLSDRQTRHLLVLGAYRDNEVGPTHPFTLALESFRRAGIAFATIALGPLAEADTQQLLADALGCAPQACLELAQLCIAKTGGNPFFLSQFVQALYERGLVRRDGRGFSWDLGRIRNADVTDNVVDLVAQKLALLPRAAQRALHVAACIGNRFDLNTLLLATGMARDEVMAALWPSLEEGLVLPLGEAYQFADDPLVGEVEFRFLHDRVQQAAYVQLADDDRQRVHARLGELLLSGLAPAELDERLFEIVNHLYAGRRYVGAPVHELAALMLAAGRKAKACAAYDRAFEYFAAADDLLPASAWESRHELAFAIRREHAESAYVTGRRDEADRLFVGLADSARSAVDRADVCLLRVVSLNNQTRNDEALRVGLEGLHWLGVDLPVEPHAVADAVAAARARLAPYLTGRAAEAVLELSEAHDPIVAKRAALLTTMFAVTYATNQDMCALVILTMCEMLFEHGTFRAAPFALGMLGIVTARSARFAEAYELGQLAMQLSKKLGTVEYDCKVWFCFGCFIAPWQRPLAEAIGILHKAIQAGPETGDRVYGSFAIHCMEISSFAAQSSSLEDTLASVDKHLPLASHPGSRAVLRFIRAACTNLSGHTAGPTAFDMADDAERECMNALAKYPPGHCFALALKVEVLYLRGEIEAARATARDCEKYVRFVSTTLYAWPLYLYGGLAETAAAASAASEEREAGIRQARAHLDVLGAWAEACPQTYGHSYELLSAEIARVEGRTAQALRHYRDAIKSAAENGFVANQGVAHELAARFYLAEDLPDEAASHLRSALRCFGRWGATAKVHQVEGSYRALMTKAADDPATPMSVTSTSTLGSTLDVAAVLEASQAISREMDLPTLLGNLMRIVIANAGAERGLLFMEKGSGGIAVVASDRVETAVGSPAPDADGAPMGLVNYVARSAEGVLLRDASREGPFVTDPYIQARGVRAVLCEPIVHQGKLSAVLYLENSLVSGAFTEDRRAVVRMLSAQAAISIENARAYASLRETERIAFEVQTAKTVQQFLVPKVDPEVPGIELSSFYHPASETGGDWFDYVYDEERGMLDIAVGDVSGHGVPAALIASIVAGFFFGHHKRGEGESPRDPAELLSAVDHLLYKKAAGEYRMTFSYSRIALERRVIQYSLGGHHSIYVWRRDADGGGRIIVLGKPSPVLGSDQGSKFENQESQLEVDDVLVWFTDGLLENTSARFGVRLLMKLVAKHAASPAATIRDRIIEEAWRGVTGDLADDVTLIIGKVR